MRFLFSSQVCNCFFWEQQYNSSLDAKAVRIWNDWNKRFSQEQVRVNHLFNHTQTLWGMTKVWGTGTAVCCTCLSQWFWHTGLWVSCKSQGSILSCLNWVLKWKWCVYNHINFFYRECLQWGLLKAIIFHMKQYRAFEMSWDQKWARVSSSELSLTIGGYKKKNIKKKEIKIEKGKENKGGRNLYLKVTWQLTGD